MSNNKKYVFSLGILINFTLGLLVQNLFAQNNNASLQYSSNQTLIQAEDGSLKTEIEAFGGRASAIMINGTWNRLSHDIKISDRSNQIYGFDFAFGTYTDLLTNNARPLYKVTKTKENTVQLNSMVEIQGKKLLIQRTISLLPKGQAKETLQLSNISSSDITLDSDGLAFTFGMMTDFAQVSSNNNNIPEYRYQEDKKIKKVSLSPGGLLGKPKSMAFIPDPEWITVADNFFLSIIKPEFSDTMVLYKNFSSGKKQRVGTGIQVLATNIPAGKSLSYTIDYYVGPRQESFVINFNPIFKKLFAWPAAFNWIMKPIESGTLWVMNFLDHTTGNTGIMLIIIAILVKLLLLPLSIKSAISMKKMRLLQPKLNKLQEKWGHDPQVLQQKTMELYKSEKANPLGGCLPLLLQIPVFFALFRVLSRSVELRGASFLWIKDLTLPDSLFMLGNFSFNLLPIIMTILQLVSVLLQQGRMGSTNNEMQKQMQMQSYMMPVIFLFLFWNMPAGLVLYWTVQNIFSILEQEVINLDSRIAKKSI